MMPPSKAQDRLITLLIPDISLRLRLKQSHLIAGRVMKALELHTQFCPASQETEVDRTGQLQD